MKALVAVLGVVAVVALGVVGFLLLRGGPDLEIRLEPVAVTTPDPFTSSVARSEAPLQQAIQVPAATIESLPAPPARTVAAEFEEPGPPPPAPRRVAGSLPGLYGGTRDETSCDPEGLVSFLESEPDKAAAWAEVLGITPSEIREYVDTLTPVVLTRDTRVTNHDYRDGEAPSLQSVLQAGTAVLVDARGVPRVKCGCGNPLLPPAVIDQDLEVGWRGDTWPGLDAAVLVEVVVDVSVEEFIIADLGGDKPFERPVGSTGGLDAPLEPAEVCDLFPDDPVCDEVAAGDVNVGDEEVIVPDPDEPELGTGDVQATLRWSSDADMDLAVVDPNGDTVAYYSDTSPSGGELDVDVIPCGDPDAARVENIYWPEGQAPAGTYTVRVTYYSTCEDPGPQTFNLQVLADGVLQVDETSQLATDGDIQEWTFAVGGSAAPAAPATDPGTGFTSEDVLVRAEEELRSCGLFPTLIEADDAGDGWWYVYGDADFQSGESIAFSFRYEPNTGQFLGDDSASAAAIEGTGCG
ncbi:MAG: DUF6777 domain-containing protein [Nitriliruptoraceae bacterium]